MFKIVYLGLIFIFADKLFYLFDWIHIPGVFNILDFGNFLILSGLIFLGFKSKDLQILHNIFSVLIIVVLFLILLQAPLASMYYNQSVKSGVFGIRHMFYYCSFFIFVLLLRSSVDVARLLNLLSIISFIVIGLAIVNYFVPGIFYHDWAYGHYSRAGIKRAFIPGMDLVSLSVLWQFCKWLVGDSFDRFRSRLSCCSFLFLLGAHFFRQTRSRIIAISLVILSYLASSKRFGLLVGLSVVVSLGITANEMSGGESVVLDSFRSSYENIAEGKGTWESRLEMMRGDMEAFLQHPVAGTGASAIRLRPGLAKSRRGRIMVNLSKMDDLGYTRWIKSFGIVGIIWFGFFFYASIVRGLKVLSRADDDCKVFAVFCLCYIGYVLISFVTLNHLTFPNRILPLCLVTAILVRLSNSRDFLPLEEKSA
jgi:hypothetical protein